MDVRALVVVPVALALVMLAGCGDAEEHADDGSGVGSSQVRVPFVGDCDIPSWVRKRIPEGLCTLDRRTVDDVLSPLKPRFRGIE